MPTIIPFAPSDPEQILEITLNDEPYVLRARWNTTDNDGAGSWYLDAWERDGITPIAFGIKLALGVLLGRTYGHPLFLGGMYLIDDSGTGAEAGFDDFGTRVVLLHQTSADSVLTGTTPL